MGQLCAHAVASVRAAEHHLPTGARDGSLATARALRVPVRRVAPQRVLKVPDASGILRRTHANRCGLNELVGSERFEPHSDIQSRSAARKHW